jgi:hypothetical protein
VWPATITSAACVKSSGSPIERRKVISCPAREDPERQIRFEKWFGRLVHRAVAARQHDSLNGRRMSANRPSHLPSARHSFLDHLEAGARKDFVSWVQGLVTLPGMLFDD